jgi:alpha-L-arabinofuranosidase
MFGQNSGDEYFYSKINISDKREDIKKRFGFSVVKDSKTGDYIVKAVNLLPETTKTEIDMSRLQNRGKKGIKTVLTGTIDDKTAKPVSSEIEIGSEFSLELPPYSFTVIRIIAN